MEYGHEPWKWGLVFLLLPIFLVVANQARVAITGQEDFDPPDDYLQGDSFDIEHRKGPGAGTPIDVPTDLPHLSSTDGDAPGWHPDSDDFSGPTPPSNDDEDESADQLVIPPPSDIDWNDVPDPTTR